MPRATKDLTGKQIGKWTVLERAPVHNGHVHWACVCVCGKERSVSAAHLIGGRSLSCGCNRPKGKDSGTFRHGKSNTPEHSIWMRMTNRCRNENYPEWHLYGGRGITVCQRWRESFEAFLADMGPRPSPRHSIDRYPDNDGNYEPGNCRWATPKQQARNFRKNLLVDLDGQQVSLAEACELTGINYDAAKYRLKVGYHWRGIGYG